MIGRPHRFHGYGSLRAVYKRGQMVRGPSLSLKFMDRGPGRPYRAAVVVSRKVSPSAVVRNRIRRRLYEACRQSDVQLTAGRDLVFTVFSEQLAGLEASKLHAMVDELLHKAAAQVDRGSQTPLGHDIVKSKRE